MSIAIQAVIEKRPHLKNPLEFYAKWQHFCEEAAKFLPKERAVMSPEDSKAYPRDSARPVFQLFVSIFNPPGEELEPLCQAMENGDVDFMRLPLDEAPALSLPFTEEELAPILYLLTKPYFLALRQNFPLDGQSWEEGRCPLCSARAALSSIVEGPQRNFHCTYCGTIGQYRFIGCPNCGTTDPAVLSTIKSDDEPGFSVATCEACHTYVKVVESSILKDMTMDLADMASLPLDIVAQQKGYTRTAPNPIGLKKMA